MQIEVRTFNLGRTSWVNERIESYLLKIKPFEKIKFKIIKDEKKWLDGIEPSAKLWVCDERGKAESSIQFSKSLSNLRDGGCKNLYILLGGPFGIPEEVKKKGDKIILLSPFVMNQEVALVVLFEQIFRAYTIINNHPYHNT